MRSCCKNRYLVTLTFAPLERNRGSRAQIHKNSLLFDNFSVHSSLQQPGAAGGIVETGQMSYVETRQMYQQQSSVLSQQQTSLSEQHIVCVSETGQGPDTCNRDGSRQPYSNFSNRPHPPRQNRGAVLMGMAVWRVTEKPKKIKWQWGQYVR